MASTSRLFLHSFIHLCKGVEMLFYLGDFGYKTKTDELIGSGRTNRIGIVWEIMFRYLWLYIKNSCDFLFNLRSKGFAVVIKY